MKFWQTPEFKIVYSQIKNKNKFYFGILGALLAAGITGVIPYIYGRLVDLAISPNSRTELILALILSWLILSVTRDLVDNWSSRQSWRIGIAVNNNLFVDIFQHLITLPLQFHKDRKVGKILRRIDKGLEDLYQIMETTIFSFLPDLFTFAVALTVLLIV